MRSRAFHPEPVTWEGHVDWFRRKMADPNCLIVILSDKAGSPVGQVRFDVGSEKSAEMDISIASECRGRGLGAEVIRLACDYLGRERSVSEVVAYIKPDNVPSLRAFEKAGFVAQGRRVVHGQEAVWMSREVDEQP